MNVGRGSFNPGSPPDPAFAGLPTCSAPPTCMPPGIQNGNTAGSYIHYMSPQALYDFMHTLPTAAAQAAFYSSMIGLGNGQFQNLVRVNDFGGSLCNCTPGDQNFNQWINYYQAQGPLPGGIDESTGQVVWNWNNTALPISDPNGPAPVAGALDTGSMSIPGWTCP